MTADHTTDVTVVCPCCGARLTIDTQLRKVIAHEAAAQKHHDAPDLDRAADLLREQKMRREALFQKSTEDEKSKSQLLERKFEEALKKSKDEPITKPQRDIDL
jgi:uncharacterized Zn finger protein (UPF0148 family)